jgi:CheY-like chemotaxis protein
MPAGSESMQGKTQREDPRQCRTGGQRILVVDDHRDSAELLSILLEIEGHQVSMAHDGDEALAVACEFSPEVVILDLGLPVADGFQVAQRLRRLFPGVRLVAATGRAEPEIEARCRSSGFERTLVKPIDAQELRSLLGRKSVD